MSSLRLFLPNKAGWFFFLLLALFLFSRPLSLLADGSTARYVLSGVYFFQHATWPTTNYLTAVAPNLPLGTTAFLAEVAYGAFYKLFGLNGVVLLAAAAIALSLTISYQLARMRGMGMLPGLVMLCLATSVTSLHWLARPHVFTYILLLIVYYLVFISGVSKRRRLLLLSLLACVWANTHGSFYLMAAMLGAKLVADLLTNKQADDRADVRASDSFKYNAMTLLAVLVSSAVNTRGGPGLLYYVFQYMSSQAVANSEWRSIDFSVGAPIWSFLALAVVAITVVAYSSRRPNLGEFAFLLVLFLFSLYAMRIMPYFALALLPALAPQWQCFAERFAAPADDSPLNSALKKLASLDARIAAQEPDSPLVVVASLVISLATAGAFVLMPNLKIADFDPANLPVACLDYVNKHHISGMPFTQDNWAPYVFWKTGKKVFIDDCTNLYPTDAVHDYTSLYFTYPDWPLVLKRRRFAYILVPRGLPLAQLLLANSDWKRCCEDPAGMLFLPTQTQQSLKQ